MTNYQTLDAWKISMDLVKEVYVLVRKFPKEEQFGLAAQIRRAVVSVPANIAEGMGRQYKKDTLQYLHVSRGSLYELETLLIIAEQVGIGAGEEYYKLFAMVEKTRQVLNGLINYCQKSTLK